MRIGERRQNDMIENREDAGQRSNREAESGDDRHREAGSASQSSKGKS